MDIQLWRLRIVGTLIWVEDYLKTGPFKISSLIILANLASYLVMLQLLAAVDFLRTCLY